MSWEGTQELVRQAQAGGAEAWQQLHEWAQPFLLRRAGRLLGPDALQESASDLTQEVWTRAWQGIGDFRGGPGDAETAALFRAWLARILKNVHLNGRRFWQTQKRQPPPGLVHLGATGANGESGTGSRADPAADDPSPSADLKQEEQGRLIQQALVGLPDPTDVEILRLHFFEGLSLTQIAARLGVSLDRVRGSFHRSLERLRPQLDSLR
jgi:RNA polymerase sigma factor (sigma-70 family)